jgi:hypothetical protein
MLSVYMLIAQILRVCMLSVYMLNVYC